MAGKAVYFFCVSPSFDHVAADVFARSAELFDLREIDLVVDGMPVMEYRDGRGNQFVYMRQRALVSYEFSRFLPLLRERFADFDIAGEVNWHAGRNAPDRVLTVHSIGDVVTGDFSPANPVLMRNLLHSMERNREEAGLEDFSVTTEATHWTGSIKGGNPEDIPRFPVPMVDIEIGSTLESWRNAKAVDVLARSLVSVFDEKPKLRNLLCVGGVHFASCFADAALDRDHPFGISHILPSQWLVSGEYETDGGLKKMERCVETIRGGISAVVFHDGIKAPYRNRCRELAGELGIPVFKHKKLRRPDELPIW